ncbi:MAG: cytochrome c [Rhodobacteraceae bacterium]|nr:cytochrome c [Paracoccaceae bacterium]
MTASGGRARLAQGGPKGGQDMVRLAAFGAALAILAGCTPAEPEPTGRALFAQFCAGCHGSGGRGDGPAAAGLARRPADLTGIAARNGGSFPMARVMSTIDGYTRRGDGSVMPELGAVLGEGPVVLVDTGDGIATPAPARLVALAEYLRGIQVP